MIYPRMRAIGMVGTGTLRRMGRCILTQRNIVGFGTGLDNFIDY